MTISTIKGTTALFLTLTLAACGGGGGGDSSGGGGGSSTPVASTGFAEPGDTISQNVTYTAKNVTLTFARDAGAVLEVNEDDFITVTFRQNTSTGNEEARVEFDERIYTYVKQPDGRYAYIVGATASYMDREAVSDNGAAELYRFDNYIRSTRGFPETFALVIGHDTDPADVAARTGGNIMYSGVMTANAFTESSTVYGNDSWFEDNLGSGTITLVADFDNDDIAGSFTLSNFEGLTTATTYTVPEVSIVGNGFTGTFTASLPGGQSLANAEINGNFYGADAGAVGGTIFTEIRETGEETIFVQGGFLAD